MVLDYYKLAEQPFGVTPDPKYLYVSPTHREAMASVLYAVKAGRGFSALIAEPGMGKTTLLFNLLQQLGDTAKTAFLFQVQDTPRNFLRNLLSDLGVEDDGQDLVQMQAKLNECLVRETSEGKHFLVVIDEAQNLDESVLEVVRMLSNFETAREKLMHIILAGQPQLAEKLASPQLTQLRQRVSIVARLTPFNATETRAFIEHRLRVAGYPGEVSLFTDRAYMLIAKHSAGIPRNINNICFNAMSIGCATQRRAINAAVIEEVLADLDLAPLRERVSVVEYVAPPVSAVPKTTGKLAAVFPERWRLRLGIASLFALLAGIGLSVLAAKNQHAAPGLADAQAGVAQAIGSQPAAPNSSGSPAEMSDEVAPADLNKSASLGPMTNSRTTITADVTDKPLVKSELIRIGERDTLYEICMDNLGRYDDEVVKMIRDLNPGFGNPRRLRVGQEIRIPLVTSLAPTVVPAVGSGSTSAVEAKKP
jgi:type II secretory pathway predicted ATPase ExeA